MDKAGDNEGESSDELSTRHLSEWCHRETDLLEAWVDKTLKNIFGYYCTNFVISWQMDFVLLSLRFICQLGNRKFQMLHSQIKRTRLLAMDHGNQLTWKSGRKARIRIGFIICIWSGLIVTLPKTPSIWVAVSTKREPCISKSAQKNGIGRYMTMIG